MGSWSASARTSQVTCIVRQFLKHKLLGMNKWVVFRYFLTSKTILITLGAANRFLEDLSLDIPRDWFFEAVFETKNVKDDYVGHQKVFPNS